MSSAGAEISFSSTDNETEKMQVTNMNATGNFMLNNYFEMTFLQRSLFLNTMFSFCNV